MRNSSRGGLRRCFRWLCFEALFVRPEADLGRDCVYVKTGVLPGNAFDALI